MPLLSAADDLIRPLRILELRDVTGLSLEETAGALGLPDSAVTRGWLAAGTFVRHRPHGRGPGRA